MKFNLPRRQRKSFESIIGASSNNNFNKTQSLEIFENVKKEFMKSPKTFGSNTGKQDDILEMLVILSHQISMEYKDLNVVLRQGIPEIVKEK